MYQLNRFVRQTLPSELLSEAYAQGRVAVDGRDSAKLDETKRFLGRR